MDLKKIFLFIGNSLMIAGFITGVYVAVEYALFNWGILPGVAVTALGAGFIINTATHLATRRKPEKNNRPNG